MKKTILLLSCLCATTLINAQSQFYGMTFLGGASNLGTIFKTDGTGANCTILKDLVNGEGVKPKGVLLQANDGKLYGLTSALGTGSALGALFQFDLSTNTYTKKINFNNTNGERPEGSLIQATDNKLYGMTYYGGANNSGVIFQYDIATNTLIKKIDFSATLGAFPKGSLIQAIDGNLYGMTSEGGANDLGVLFKYDPSTNTYTKMIDFAGTTNGSNPYGSLLQASDGKLYGMTFLGGAYNWGVIFQYDPITNVLVKKIDLSGTTGSAIGAAPEGSLIKANDGKMYGVAYGNSKLFQYDFTTNIYTVKANLPSSPMGDLLQASDGNLYGTTYGGGVADMGTVYQYNYTSNTLTITTDFNSTTAVAPASGLIELSGPTNIKMYESQNNFKLFPNPTTSILNVELEMINEGTTTITINNALGQVVLTDKITETHSSFNIQNLINGLYFVTVTDNKGNKSVKKIIKE